eukprot:c29710_g1_i1 orf=38-340(+)
MQTRPLSQKDVCHIFCMLVFLYLKTGQFHIFKKSGRCCNMPRGDKHGSTHMKASHKLNRNRARSKGRLVESDGMLNRSEMSHWRSHNTFSITSLVHFRVR